MSRIETVRRAHEALNDGDVKALVTEYDPDFRLDMSDRVLNPAVYEGHEGTTPIARATRCLDPFPQGWPWRA